RGCVVGFFFFQAEDGIRDFHVTGVQTCALPIYNEKDLVGSWVSGSCRPAPNKILFVIRAQVLHEDSLLPHGGEDGFEVPETVERSEERRVGRERRAGWAGRQ